MVGYAVPCSQYISLRNWVIQSLVETAVPDISGVMSAQVSTLTLAPTRVEPMLPAPGQWESGLASGARNCI